MIEMGISPGTNRNCDLRWHNLSSYQQNQRTCFNTTDRSVRSSVGFNFWLCHTCLLNTTDRSVRSSVGFDCVTLVCWTQEIGRWDRLSGLTVSHLFADSGRALWASFWFRFPTSRDRNFDFSREISQFYFLLVKLEILPYFDLYPDIYILYIFHT